MTDQYVVSGDKLVASGLCLSRDENGEIVFSDKLIPGEVALVQDDFKKGKTRFNSIVELQDISDFRVKEPCPYVAHGCGGCDWQHIETSAQSNFKREIIVDSIVRIAKLGTYEEVSSFVHEIKVYDYERYRTSARVFINKGKWGFKKHNSHETITIKDCLILDPETQQLAFDASKAYENERGEVEVAIRRSPDLHMDQIMKVSPESFYQSHIAAPKALSDYILDKIKDLGPKLHCLDLYSGVGLFSVAMAKVGHSVVAVEGNPVAIKDAKVNSKDLDIEVIHSDVNEYFYSGEKACDVLIADPSRDGITKYGLENVLSAKAENIFLVSCDPAAGARDISLLCANGYRLIDVQPFDLFGHTHHVEMISLLKKDQ